MHSHPSLGYSCRAHRALGTAPPHLTSQTHCRSSRKPGIWNQISKSQEKVPMFLTFFQNLSSYSRSLGSPLLIAKYSQKWAMFIEKWTIQCISYSVQESRKSIKLWTTTQQSWWLITHPCQYENNLMKASSSEIHPVPVEQRTASFPFPHSLVCLQNSLKPSK